MIYGAINRPEPIAPKDGGRSATNAMCEMDRLPAPIQGASRRGGEGAGTQGAARRALALGWYILRFQRADWAMTAMGNSPRSAAICPNGLRLPSFAAMRDNSPRGGVSKPAQGKREHRIGAKRENRSGTKSFANYVR